jgi:hypothetical protein
VEAYHAVNAVVFVANALLLFAIARALLPWPWPLLAPVLLVSRLAHVQVLLYTSEFQVLSATLFSLLALRLDMAARRSGRRGLLVAALIGFALALLCKETAIVLPAIVSAYAWLYERRWRAWREAAWWMVAASWAVVFALFRRAYPEPTGFQYDLSWAVLPRLSGYFLVFWNDLVYPMDDLELVSRVARLLGHPLAGLGAGPDHCRAPRPRAPGVRGRPARAGLRPRLVRRRRRGLPPPRRAPVHALQLLPPRGPEPGRDRDPGRPGEPRPAPARATAAAVAGGVARCRPART